MDRSGWNWQSKVFNGVIAKRENIPTSKLKRQLASAKAEWYCISKKVLIAASLMTPAHLYIWDEPLNYIDVFSRMQIEKLILSYQPTMLVGEHDVRLCEKLATSVLKCAKKICIFKEKIQNINVCFVFLNQNLRKNIKIVLGF